MIPTAESFYDKKDKNGQPMSFNEKMIEFTKLHVTACKKEIASIDNVQEFGEIDEDSILNAYPLELIK